MEKLFYEIGRFFLRSRREHQHLWVLYTARYAVGEFPLYVACACGEKRSCSEMADILNRMYY